MREKRPLFQFRLVNVVPIREKDNFKIFKYNKIKESMRVPLCGLFFRKALSYFTKGTLGVLQISATSAIGNTIFGFHFMDFHIFFLSQH